jgi:hypothetical protein
VVAVVQNNFATSRAPRLSLGIRNKTIIRSDMKSILNFRHNIEKYGFIWIEFGNPHPCVQSPSHAIVAAECEASADKKKNRETLERRSWHCLHSSPKTEGCDIALILLRPWAHQRHSGRVCTISVECEVLVRTQGLGGRGRSQGPPHTCLRGHQHGVWRAGS